MFICLFSADALGRHDSPPCSFIHMFVHKAVNHEHEHTNPASVHCVGFMCVRSRPARPRQRDAAQNSVELVEVLVGHLQAADHALSAFRSTSTIPDPLP